MALDPIAYFHLPGRQEVYDAIKADFKEAADAVTGRNLPLRASHVGEPAAYGGKWVAWVLFRITSQGTRMNPDGFPLPSEVIVQVLTVMPVTYPGGGQGQGQGQGTQSGRGYAEDLTTNGFSAFEKSLYSASLGVREKCDGLYTASTAAGSHNEFGRAMFWDEEETVLWAHSADMRVVL